MSMKQNIEIDGKQVPFKASAAIPRIYRMKSHRDIYKDLRSLEKSFGDGDEESSNLDLFSLEMFENIAYVMAKHTDSSIPDSPDYIPVKASHVFITHRIFMKFSGNAQVEVYVDFSGIVTQETLREELKKKEPAFDKNSAFNQNSSDHAADYMPMGKKAHPGGSSSVARADHVHPLGTMLKFAENNWNSGGVTNLLPDTNRWVMSNGHTPDVWGSYAFDATFTSVWEGFSCFFDADLMENVRGKTVKFGGSSLTGASSRLELIVDGSMANYILAADALASAEVSILETAAEVTLRIIIFSADDLYCAFGGVYLYDKEEETAGDGGKEIYLAVQKVLQEKLPPSGVSGTLYITERGNLYLAGDGGTLIPLAGSEAI